MNRQNEIIENFDLNKPGDDWSFRKHYPTDNGTTIEAPFSGFDGNKKSGNTRNVFVDKPRSSSSVYREIAQHLGHDDYNGRYKNKDVVHGEHKHKREHGHSHQHKHSRSQSHKKIQDVPEIFAVEKSKEYQQENYEVVTCPVNNQLNFCVPISFDQELVSGPGGIGDFIPLSRGTQNFDKIHGVLQLTFNRSLSNASYKLYVYNGNAIIAAHLHAGAANENGQIIVPLYSAASKNVNGKLAEGVISNKNIVAQYVSGAYNFNSIASIYEGIRRGLVYINVYNESFPDGICRGQIYLRDSCL